MKIDVSSYHKIQSKKYDFVKIAFILQNVSESITANQINYYFNRIFPQTYCNTQRIAQIIKQKPDIFTIIRDYNSTSQSNLYSFKGSLILNKTTKINWENKSRSFFRTPL
tara:strand:- start:498 stop:827 length:330 start_codon:yes stop_codon:yes gene_type:complete